MNWMKRMRPRITAALKSGKTETPDNLWAKCPGCEAMNYCKDLAKAQKVCPKCNHHYRLGAKERMQSLFDNAKWTAIDFPDVYPDPLTFQDTKPYAKRLEAARKSTKAKDAVQLGYGTVHKQPMIIAVQDFAFMGGSLGMAAGEALIAGATHACERHCAYIVFTAAGGARMQEGILSLMQMPRTTVAIQRLRALRLPYIVVLTDPTTGGVTASYGMLGDIHIAEPNALIGFAGPRVIEQTINETLPKNFQRAEYLLEHGMIDMVVHRRDLRTTLARLVRLLHTPQADAASHTTTKAAAQ